MRSGNKREFHTLLQNSILSTKSSILPQCASKPRKLHNVTSISFNINSLQFTIITGTPSPARAGRPPHQVILPRPSKAPVAEAVPTQMMKTAITGSIMTIVTTTKKARAQVSPNLPKRPPNPMKIMRPRPTTKIGLLGSQPVQKPTRTLH